MKRKGSSKELIDMLKSINEKKLKLNYFYVLKLNHANKPTSGNSNSALAVVGPTCLAASAVELSPTSYPGPAVIRLGLFRSGVSEEVVWSMETSGDGGGVVRLTISRKLLGENGAGRLGRMGHPSVSRKQGMDTGQLNNNSATGRQEAKCFLILCIHHRHQDDPLHQCRLLCQ
ncbi:hypothetical protein Tco_0093752 [Tanacetum coccineum]